MEGFPTVTIFGVCASQLLVASTFACPHHFRISCLICLVGLAFSALHFLPSVCLIVFGQMCVWRLTGGIPGGGRCMRYSSRVCTIDLLVCTQSIGYASKGLFGWGALAHRGVSYAIVAGGKKYLCSELFRFFFSA